MLEPVSKTMLKEEEAQAAPQHPPVFDVPDGPNISDVYTFVTGQPFDHYDRLREQAPVAWIEFDEKYPDFKGYWALTKYEDIKQAEVLPEIFSSQAGSIFLTTGFKRERETRLSRAAVNNLICLDRQAHTPLRMQHRHFFTPEFTQRLRGKVEVYVDSLLDKMARKGGTLDLVSNFSEHIPMFTLSEMLGVDEKDRPRLIRWMHYLELAQHYFATRDRGGISPLFIAKFLFNVRQMFKYGERVLADRRKNPRDDLLTCIAHAEIGDQPLSQAYLDGSWLLILFAGNDTARNSISGTMRLLSDNPEQKQICLEDPSKIQNMAQEALRLVSPVINMRRTLTEDYTIRGQKMAAGEKVVFYYGAANRDPDIFDDPTRFDILRPNADQHIAFGYGPHNCLGKRIAIMQLEVAYERLLARFPDMHWTGKDSHAPNTLVSAITSLEVNLGR
ncbi:MAG: cytochrome P450 [Parvibaculales bacterium]